MERHLNPESRARYGLYAICFGFFLVLLDTSALNVAIGAMQREFGGAISGLQWVVNSYTIVFAGLLLVFGAVGDRFGVRLLYQIGLAIFTVMSLLCALSPGVGFLIAARALQGLGAAVMLPASLSLLSHAFPQPADRAKAVSFWASIVSLGFAAGPALGGVLTSCFGWRSIFWINVPVGIVAWAMIRAFVTESKVPNPRHIDWAGQIAASMALLVLTYALIDAGRAGWTAPRVLAGVGLSALLALVFVYIERHSASPVLPPGLFSKPVFSVCIATGVVLNFGVYGTLFIVSIYLQNARHLSALSTGLMILPFTCFPTIATRLITKYWSTAPLTSRLATGHTIMAAGAAVLALTLRVSGYEMILLGLSLLGIGMGFVMPAMTTGVLTSSPTETSGLASGILNSARQVGGTLGVALMGTLLQRHQHEGLFWSFAIAAIGYLIMAGATLGFVRNRN